MLLHWTNCLDDHRSIEIREKFNINKFDVQIILEYWKSNFEDLLIVDLWECGWKQRANSFLKKDNTTIIRLNLKVDLIKLVIKIVF